MFFAQFAEDEVDLAGREWIVDLVKSHDPMALADRWSRDKWAYPFFTPIVIDMLYMAHYAATRQNKLDRNAQTDLNLMDHLMHSDVLVTNETGFIKNAFDDIWRPRGNVMMDAEKFVNLTNKL